MPRDTTRRIVGMTSTRSARFGVNAERELLEANGMRPTTGARSTGSVGADMSATRSRGFGPTRPVLPDPLGVGRAPEQN
jgi:hypothetical protein